MKLSMATSMLVLSEINRVNGLSFKSSSLTRMGAKYRNLSFGSPRLAMNMDVTGSDNSLSKIREVGTSLQSSVLMDPPVISDATQDEDSPSVIQEQQKTYLDDGFVFGLEGSGIERPKGGVASVVVEDDSLDTKPYQVVMVSATLGFHALLAANSISEMYTSGENDVLTTFASSMAIILSSWLSADFGSGVLHWSVDNYGNGRTPIMGNIIAAFQGHHSAQWTITQREFCNNVHKLCIPFGIPTMLLINFISGPGTTLFFTVFCVLEIMSQEMHKWSHTSRKDVPDIVNWMQDAGLSIGRKSHAQHHKAPYKGNYCIVSGICNPALDDSGFFRRLEHIVYNINGVESNSWKLDGGLRERTLRGDYSIKGK